MTPKLPTPNINSEDIAEVFSWYAHETESAPDYATYCRLFDDLARLRAALADAEAKLEQVRQILAGTAVGSLPDDYPVERLALETWNTLQERTLEGLALIGKVEAAEAKLVKAREALNAIHYWVDASDVELKEANTTRDEALFRARELREITDT